ncbi:hypothetical protein RUM43_012670 [Polyplax serrata]|uniref:Uncharacterized protein n=1 Tax=Polyplax serrata TaxID=468196 RepID=A0AAN8P5F8_POLSC
MCLTPTYTLKSIKEIKFEVVSSTQQGTLIRSQIRQRKCRKNSKTGRWSRAKHFTHSFSFTSHGKINSSGNFADEIPVGMSSLRPPLAIGVKRLAGKGGRKAELTHPDMPNHRPSFFSPSSAFISFEFGPRWFGPTDETPCRPLWTKQKQTDRKTNHRKEQAQTE